MPGPTLPLLRSPKCPGIISIHTGDLTINVTSKDQSLLPGAHREARHSLEGNDQLPACHLLTCWAWSPEHKKLEKICARLLSPVSSSQHDLAMGAHSRVRADSWRVPIHWSPSSVTRPGHRKEKGEPQTLGSPSTESNCHQTFFSRH